MKKLVLFILTVFMMACQPNDNGGAGVAVTTPLNMSCINGTSYCNNSIYGHTYGWRPYPGLYNYAYDYTSYFNQYGFCNCPGGYLPVYNGTYGLGCVSAQILEPFAGLYTYWSWGAAVPAPQTTINIPQYSNIPGASNSAYSCSRTLTQSCLLDQGNTCGAGATCRQTIAGSNLGVCVVH